MAHPISSDFRHSVPTMALVFFVLGTFAITWGVVGSYILFPEESR